MLRPSSQEKIRKLEQIISEKSLLTDSQKRHLELWVSAAFYHCRFPPKPTKAEIIRIVFEDGLIGVPTFAPPLHGVSKNFQTEGKYIYYITMKIYCNEIQLSILTIRSITIIIIYPRIGCKNCSTYPRQSPKQDSPTDLWQGDILLEILYYV